MLHGTGEGAITNVLGCFTLEIDTTTVIKVNANGYNGVMMRVNPGDSLTIMLRANDSGLRQLEGDDNLVKAFVKSLERYQFFSTVERLLNIYVDQYFPLNGKDSKIELGEFSSFFGSNHLEGVNLEMGFRTTNYFSRHLFLKGHSSYGFKDRKIKYGGSVEYSFAPKERYSYSFPVNSITLTHDYGSYKIGQQAFDMGIYEPTVTLNLQSNNKLLYKRFSQIKYTLENRHHFSCELSLEHNQIISSYLMPLLTATGVEVDKYTMAGMKLRLRYAPLEQLEDNNFTRKRLIGNTPVFVFSHTWYPKHFLGGDYELNKTEFGIYNRVGILRNGYIEGFLNVGKIWNKGVPYPSLLYANSNLSLFMQNNSFSLLDPMEFPLSEYCTLDLCLNTGGLLVNRIPLCSKLTEVLSLKCLWGHLSGGNNPMEADVIRIPKTVDWGTLEYDKPYAEVGIGIDNILSLLRIDYVHRLSYRNRANTHNRGFRLKLTINI